MAVPRTAAEVSEVVRAAAAAGLRVAPQSTGHNSAPLAARGMADVVLVRTSALTEVSVDRATLTARVGGGVEWEAAVNAAAAEGLTTLHGSSPNVGIAGYSLGGGTGWYARKLGLAANHLTAIEIVIADGTLVRADADHHAELFWALRGGGGNFGVVTALEFDLFDFNTAYAGMMIWDASRAREVLQRWAPWSIAAPDEVTTSFRVLNLPPLPELPDFLRGRSVVVIDGAVLADDATSAKIIEPLRALQPEIDTFATVPTAALIRLHMDPEEKTPVASDTIMLSALPEDAIESFVAAATAPGTALMMSELRQLGGALGRPHPGGGAVSQFHGQFLVFAGGMAMTPEMGMAAEADAMALTGVARRMGQRLGVPELRRERDGRQRGLPEPDLGAAEGDPLDRRSRRDLRRQPRDPPGLTHRLVRSSARYGALRICQLWGRVGLRRPWRWPVPRVRRSCRGRRPGRADRAWWSRRTGRWPANTSSTRSRLIDLVQVPTSRVATALPEKLVTARASDMKRSMPTITPTPSTRSGRCEASPPAKVASPGAGDPGRTLRRDHHEQQQGDLLRNRERLHPSRTR